MFQYHGSRSRFFEVVMLILQERVSERNVEQKVNAAVPWIREEFVEFVGVIVLSVRVHVVRLILLEHTQQVFKSHLLSSLTNGICFFG